MAGAGYLERVFRATEEENRRAILAALPQGAGGRLLDLGCHDGEFTVRVADRLRAEQVRGVEFIEQHAERARRRGIAVHVGDLDSGLPYPDGSIDTVHSNQVIEHVRFTDVFLSEIRRVLRPGGLACLSTNNLASWHNIVALVLGFQPFPMHVSDELTVGNPIHFDRGRPHPDRGRSHLRMFTGRALSELCSHHGLEQVSLRTVGYYPLPPALGRAAAQVDRLHGAFLLGLFTPAAAV
jgi:SAM-dependent methyltransferase